MVFALTQFVLQKGAHNNRIEPTAVIFARSIEAL